MKICNLYNKEIKILQSCLSIDLLSPRYKKIVTKSDHFTTGHCAIATEALYYILGGKKKGFAPKVFSYIENGSKFTHWWLVNENDEIIDPTAEQYNGFTNYHLGRRIGFMQPQKKPSKRAQILIDRFKVYAIYDCNI